MNVSAYTELRVPDRAGWNWRRIAEYMPFALLVCCIFQSYDGWYRACLSENEMNNKDFSAIAMWLKHDWLELLTLAAWTVSPIALRPLSDRNDSAQQRYALCCLTVVAGVLWFALGAWSDLGYRKKMSVMSDHLTYWDPRATRAGPEVLTLLPVFVPVVVAGYLRLGWREAVSRAGRAGD